MTTTRFVAAPVGSGVCCAIENLLGRKTPRAYASPAGDCADDHEWLGAARNRRRQGSIRGFMGKILGASKKAHEGAAFVCHLITDRAAEHRIAGLQSIEHGSLGNFTADRKQHLAIDVGKFTQMRRQSNADHGNVCASTDTTAGRSRTIAVQVSPASAEA